MICGWSFYPLLTLGAEHCYRTLEAAVRCRCQLQRIPVSTLNNNVTALFKANVLTEDKDLWDALRFLRNMASHPEQVRTLDPRQAQGTLELVAKFLNRLFP
jgi:hypothetical protein